MGVVKPWTAAMLELLGDGQWHDRAEVLAAGMAVVPPGRAYRVGEWDRNRRHQRPNGPSARVRGTGDLSIAGGARRIAVECLKGYIKRGKVDRDGGRYRLSTSTRSR